MELVGTLPKMSFEPNVSLESHLGTELTFGQTSSPGWDSDSPSAQQCAWTGWAIPNAPWMGVFPRDQGPDCEMLWFPLPFAGEIIWAMCSLAAEMVGVRILSRESRSVGHPRSVLYGVEALWFLEQPELQSPRERGMASQAGQGIGTVWYHGRSRASWAQHGGGSPALFSFPEEYWQTTPKMKDRLKGNSPPSVRVIIFHCNFFLLFFGLTLGHVRISVPQPGIKPTSPALKMQSLNHRPPGKSSTTNYFKLHVIQLFLSLYKKTQTRGFPGDPIAKTPCSQCRGPKFNSWSGN